jgi:hypothetical protein
MSTPAFRECAPWVRLMFGWNETVLVIDPDG